MILIFSTNTNRESVAYRSFNFTSIKLEVPEKLPQGLTKVISPSSSKEYASAARCCATLSNCGKSLKLYLPSQGGNTPDGQGNDLGYGKNDRDERKRNG